MHKIRLIHWNPTEAKQRVEFLKTVCYDVSYDNRMGPDMLRKLKNNPPIAVIIDLSRLPSQGRDVALHLRQRKSTRHIPVIFVEGDPEKVVQIKKLLPDATYTNWDKIESSLKYAITHPVSDPVVHDSIFVSYKGTPLLKKLGIKAESAVVLLNAPPDFERTLGKLPYGVMLHQSLIDSPDLIIWFVKSKQELEQSIQTLASQIGKGGIWITWPKKTSKINTDLTQQQVREIGLATGLVDYKICALDNNWSGLRFTRRKVK